MEGVIHNNKWFDRDLITMINFIFKAHNITIIINVLYTTTIILYTDASYIHKLSILP